MKGGALYLYDNALDRLDVFIDDGRLDSVTNLLEPQLFPVSAFEQYTEMEFRFISSQRVYAVALWGVNTTSIASKPVLTIENFAGFWEPIDHSLIVAEVNPFQPAHLIALFDEPVDALRLRVTPVVNAGTSMSIGHIQFATVLQDHDLADSDWSQELLDIASKDESEGGQIFTAGGATRRQLSISHQTMRAELMYGIPDNQQPIQLGAPDVTNNWSPVGGADLQHSLTSGQNGQNLQWNDVLETGANYLLEYELRARRVSGTVLDFGLQLSSAPQPEFLQPGRRFAHFFAISDNLSVFASTGSYTVDLEILSLNRTSSPAPTGFPIPTWTELLAIAGLSKPIGVVLWPTRPTEARVSTIFGYVDSYKPYFNEDGRLTGGGLTLTETF